VRVLVDATMLDGGPSGAATRLAALHEAHRRRGKVEPTYLVRPGVEPLHDAECIVAAGLDSPWGRLRAGPSLDRLVRAADAHVLAAGALPVARVRAAPVVLTVHDLRFLDAGSWQSLARRAWGRWMLPSNLRRVDHVVAVSETTAEQLRRRLLDSSVPVTVVPNARTPGLEPVRDVEALAAFRRGAGLNSRYVMTLGPIAPHKRPGFLLAALELARRHPEGRDLALVVAGRVDPDAVLTLASRARALGVEEAVRVVGPLDDEALATALTGADAYLACGVSEGFSIPVVDAQHFGVPVVAVRAGALPETCGDGAWLVDPDDPAGLAAAMLDATTPGDLREARLGHGRELAGRWSWDTSAARLEAAWERIGARV